MFDKILIWFGNMLLASILVILSSQQAAFAQDTDTSEEQENTAAELALKEGKIAVELTGTATMLEIGGLTISPTSVDSGLVEIGESKLETVTLSHVGSAETDPITINATSLFGKSEQEYFTAFAGFITLYPGDSQTIEVLFTPAIPGVKSAGLRLDIEGSSSPYVLLFKAWSRYPLTSTLANNNEKVNFGQIFEGKTVQKKFSIRNDGENGAPIINVSAIELTGDTPDAFVVEFTPLQIQPGETKELTVIMSSPNAGFKAANVEIFHDGANSSIELLFEGNVVQPMAVPVNFSQSTLQNVSNNRATTLQFGPDGKLYVGVMDGVIYVYAITRNGKDNYTGQLQETINLIKNVQNHNDDGTVNNGLGKRLLTGILVVGTAAKPIIYAASSDPRQAAGPSGTDSNLDTNSGILHKLTKNGGGWVKQDVVRGLPRSEENHVPNGLALIGNKILLNTGGHTNMGAPSNNFARLPEYALSGAVVEINLGAIGGGTYDLPTLDDEDRSGVNDANDPFGGNNGKNMAKLVNGGPVQIYASGLRNAFDLVVTEAGNIYSFDNGPNPGWGGDPVGNCTNDRDDGGSFYSDNLHRITKGSYAGHPNPTRGNKNNTFNNSNPQTPIEGPASPEQCNYKAPGQDGSLTTIKASSNGIDEYTAGNFGGAMQGDLLVAAFNKSIYRLQLNGAGTAVTSKSKLFANLKDAPLDVTTTGSAGPFPGTIWVLYNFGKYISVFEPADF